MTLQTSVKNAVQALSGNAKTKNSLLKNEANNFLQYGNRNQPLIQNWSQVEMRDEDMYTGYSYAAITKRANRTSVLGRRFIMTEASPKTIEQFKVADMELVHPYLKAIYKSKEFSEKQFWYEISTYLDLEGVYYLMAVRAVGKNKVGAVQKFILTNPYEVRKVIKESTGEVGGYIESHNGLYREIPPEMMIEIRQLNPFNKDKAYSMTDAAKESQFTLKQAGDYTRQTLNGNISAPGIISTDVLLDDMRFDNFKQRIVGRQKGEPIFGNGSGAVTWQDMQVDLDKASLDKINEIQRSILFAVSGLSKTGMGIEESGTGREVSKTQKDDFTENAIIPRVEDIADAMNLDYRRWYPEWEENEFEIVVENPLESDRDAEKKDIEIRDGEYDLAVKLYNAGYEWNIAQRYAHGDITLEELGEPTELSRIAVEPIAPTTTATTPVAPTPVEEKSVEPKLKATEAKVETSSLKVNNQIAAKDYSDVLADVVPEDLGCIMLDVEPLEVLKYVEDAESDLVNDDDVDYSSVPGEDVSHVTLLYGLLENGNIWKDKVDALLDGWKLDKVTIDKVGSFDLEDKTVIVAHIKVTPELLDGHDRLTLLPHANSFSDYLPHISLAYIKNEADTNKWIKSLGKIYNGKTIKTVDINYGDKPEDDEEEDNHCTHELCQHNHVAAHLSDLGADHGSLSQTGLILAENSLDSDTRDIVQGQENALKAGIALIEADIITDCVAKLNKNAYDIESDVITKKDKEERVKQLETLLIGYYTFLFPIYGRQLLSKRSIEYAQIVPFEFTSEIKNYIKATAEKAAISHVDTVLSDVLKASNTTYTNILETELIKVVQDELSKGIPSYVAKLPKDATLDQIAAAVKAGEFDATKAYKLAADLAKSGASRDQIIRAIKLEYSSISKNRAITIARTETARAFNQSQFQADRQFLNNSGLMSKAYKKLRSRSGTPCEYCQALIAQPPIPFEKNFKDLGTEISAVITKENGQVMVKKMPVNYEAIESGNVHVNCQCEYVLIVEGYND